MTTSITTGMRRRQNMRLVLFLIILATLPFYCAGIFLWGTAPQTRGRTPTPSSTVRATVTPLATRTPGGFLLPTSPGGFATIGPLQNTPGQFVPPPVLPTFAFGSPTFVIPLTSSPAPTLTLFVPPTATFPPAATDTPIPFATETAIPDSDGDGVPDNLDLCPGVPGVAPSGCPPTASPTAELGPPPLPSDTPLPF